METLLGSSERQRATFAWKCADLSADQLSQRLGPSALILGRLLKHLAYMEDLSFTRDLAGAGLPEPWAGHDASTRSDWLFESADGGEPSALYRMWSEATARSRSVALGLAERDRGGGSAATTSTAADGRTAPLRRLMVDMIGEYGRHTGPADLIREAIDGRVGEDRPGRRVDFRLDRRAGRSQGRRGGRLTRPGAPANSTQTRFAPRPGAAISAASG